MSDQSIGEKLLTVEQVAAQLGFSIETVRRYIKWGVGGKKLKAVKIGRQYRVKAEDLSAFINERAA